MKKPSELRPDQPWLDALELPDLPVRWTPKLVDYIALHMERSAEGAARIVAEIDRVALETKRNVGQSVAREALQRLAALRGE